MMESARRVAVHSIDDIRVETIAAQRPARGQVLIRSSLVGICGSDTHAAHGRHPFISLPFWPGHEVIGRVAETGHGVDGKLRGRRVVVVPTLACGECDQCLGARSNICDSLAVFGCQTPGGMTDSFVIAADRVMVLSDGLEDERAALIEPLATPVHAVRRSGDLRGKRVLIIGAGPIGLFLTITALDAGAGRVVVADLVTSKRARAERLGASASFDPTDAGAAIDALAELGGKPHVVFDAVSSESTMRLGIDALEKGGRLMIIGVPRGPTSIRLDLVQDRELELIGNLMYSRDDILQAIELLTRRTFPVDEFVTATFDVADAAAAFTAADDPEQMKVLISFKPSEHRTELTDA